MEKSKPNEIARMLDTFGEDRILTLAKQGDTQELVKVIYQLASEQKYPGGVKNPLHPIHKRKEEGTFMESKKYSGLYFVKAPLEDSNTYYYFITEKGIENAGTPNSDLFSEKYLKN